MTPHALRKGHMVTYLPAGNLLGRRIKAVVLGVHLDRTVTIEARHEIDEDGHPAGPYLGDVLTMEQAELNQ